jgi:hypothetical protein
MNRFFGTAKKEEPNEKIILNNEIRIKDVNVYNNQLNNLQSDIDEVIHAIGEKEIQIAKYESEIKSAIRQDNESKANTLILLKSTITTQLELKQTQLGQLIQLQNRFSNIVAIENTNRITQESNNLMNQFMTNNARENNALDIMDDNRGTNKEFDQITKAFNRTYGSATKNMTQECNSEFERLSRQIQEEDNAKSMQILDTIKVVPQPINIINYPMPQTYYNGNTMQQPQNNNAEMKIALEERQMSNINNSYQGQQQQFYGYQQQKPQQKTSLLNGLL